MQFLVNGASVRQPGGAERRDSAARDFRAGGQLHDRGPVHGRRQLWIDVACRRNHGKPDRQQGRDQYRRHAGHGHGQLRQSATFTATVSSAAGVPPDGSVQFLVNGAAYGSPVALSGATAQLAIAEPAGSYTIAAQYTGDTNYAATVPGAETTGALTVNQASTATSVAPSTLLTLASFDYTHGSFATGGVLSDAAGNLFGTASQGGPTDDGTVFEVAAGSGVVTTLAAFDGTNGSNPRGGLLEDASGNLFGTAYYGGSASVGTVFEVAAGSHTITTLATFTGTNGANPNVTLIEDGGGNLFGTTQYGGTSHDGTVFEVVKGSGAVTTLASFNGGNGFEPVTSLVEDSQRQSLRHCD